MKVPFLDLHAQYLLVKDQVDNAIRNTVNGAVFVRGEAVALFEDRFKALVDTGNCISTGSGTDAIFIILKTLGIQPGDEILTPAFSWISSSEVISLCNAKPVFVDVHPETYTIDPALIEKKITPKTKAVIVVHLYGQAAQVAEIKKICDKHALFLIEDCAQAHLTEENGKYTGTCGHAGAFSFYPTKNLGAYGDAGGIITGNDELAAKMRRFSNHGALTKDDHLLEGMNSRMDTIQAAILLAKLPFLKNWNEMRRASARLYNDLLRDVTGVSLPSVRPGTVHTYHQYVIRAVNRDKLRKYLEEKDIQTLIHYPQALPDLPAYRYLNHVPEEFPVASRLQHQVLSLPVYPGLTEEQIRYVAAHIKEFYTKN